MLWRSLKQKPKFQTATLHCQALHLVNCRKRIAPETPETFWERRSLESKAAPCCTFPPVFTNPRFAVVLMKVGTTKHHKTTKNRSNQQANGKNPACWHNFFWTKKALLPARCQGSNENAAAVAVWRTLCILRISFAWWLVCDLLTIPPGRAHYSWARNAYACKQFPLDVYRTHSRWHPGLDYSWWCCCAMLCMLSATVSPLPIPQGLDHNFYQSLTGQGSVFS